MSDAAPPRDLETRRAAPVRVAREQVWLAPTPLALPLEPGVRV